MPKSTTCVLQRYLVRLIAAVALSATAVTLRYKLAQAPVAGSEKMIEMACLIKPALDAAVQTMGCRRRIG